MFLLSLLLIALLVCAQAGETLEALEFAHQLSISGSACSYNGVDYSGLSVIPDISVTVENPCGFPSGTFDYFLAFCRPVSRNSSVACHEAGASICAIEKESGKMIIITTFPGNSIMKPINGNHSLGLSIQGETDGQQGFLNVFCPNAAVPGSPRAEYSPWLPNFVTSTVSNSVNSNGDCDSVEFGFNILCICPGSGGCENPLPSFPVKNAIMDLKFSTVACAGPNGSIFSMANFNLTVYKSFPDGHGGFSSVPFASSPHFFIAAFCVWSPLDEALYIGVNAKNTTGCLIVRVQQDLVEEFVWFGDYSIMESIAYYDGSILASIISRNYTLSNTIFQYPVKGNKVPARTYYNAKMEGFGNIYINPLTGILYSAYSFGYYGLNLKTEEITNNEIFYITFFGFAFSNDGGPEGNGTMYLLSQSSGTTGNFPSCQFSVLKPGTAEMTLLGNLDECGVVLTQPFFMDSNNQLWAGNWGRLFQMDFKTQGKSSPSSPSIEFLEK